MQGSSIIGLTSFLPTIGGSLLLINAHGELLLLAISIISTGGGAIVLLSSAARLVVKRVYRTLE